MALIPLNTFKTKTKVLPSFSVTTSTVTAYVAPIGVTSIILMAQVANVSTQTQTVSFIHYRNRPVLRDAQGNGAQAALTPTFLVKDLSKKKSNKETFKVTRQNGPLLQALKGRLKEVLGVEFWENSIELDYNREGIKLFGYAALPTYSRGSATVQYLFVNGRPIKDRALIGAVRAAYSDLIVRDRHPAYALFLECNPVDVDVNVHPTKAEVRFRDPGNVRGLIISSIKGALATAGHRASTTVSHGLLSAFTSNNFNYQKSKKYYGSVSELANITENYFQRL